MSKTGYVVRCKTGVRKGEYWRDFGCWGSFNEAFVFTHKQLTYFDEELVEVRRTMAGRWKIRGVVKDE